MVLYLPRLFKTSQLRDASGVTQGPMPIKGLGQVIPDTISSSISDGVDNILL